MAADARTGSRRFLAVYALANAGGVVAYLPLLTLLLPLKIESVAGDQRLGLLTIVTLGGAIVASGANILFGHLSDAGERTRGHRKHWIAAGLVATIASYALIAVADRPGTLAGAMILFQIALNMLLAPLVATMADAIPDAQKGVAGGLLACAAPTGSILGGALAQMAWLGEDGRLASLCAIMVAMIAPLLVAAIPRTGGNAVDAAPRALRPVDLSLLWTARLLMQIAGNVLFTYLLFYFESIDSARAPIAVAARVGHATGIALLISVPVSILVGRMSDRMGVRRPFLLGSAALTAVGLGTMASAGQWSVAVCGYGLFSCGLALFLGLHSAFAMQMLPSPRHRGRDLGVLNLTNTLPALLGPSLTWVLTDQAGFGRTLTALAMLALLGGVLILGVEERR